MLSNYTTSTYLNSILRNALKKLFLMRIYILLFFASFLQAIMV